MLSLLFYGYATGLRSSRKLEDKCIRDDYYKLLMQYYTPDHRTINDFRKNNLAQINNYFVDVLTMFSLLGYKNIGKIYIDGSKLKANASACRTKTKKGYKKWLSRIKKEVAAILKEAVTEANDRHQLEPMIEKNESNTGEALEEVTADSGYGSYDNYEYLEDKGINGFVPDQYFQKYKSGEYEKEENRYHYTNFKYDELADSYICPEGEKLVYCKRRTKKSKTRQWNHKVYRGERNC